MPSCLPLQPDTAPLTQRGMWGAMPCARKSMRTCALCTVGQPPRQGYPRTNAQLKVLHRWRPQGWAPSLQSHGRHRGPPRSQGARNQARWAMQCPRGANKCLNGFWHRWAAGVEKSSTFLNAPRCEALEALGSYLETHSDRMKAAADRIEAAQVLPVSHAPAGPRTSSRLTHWRGRRPRGTRPLPGP